MFFGGTATTLERCKAFLYQKEKNMKEIDFNKQLVPFGKYKGQPVSVMQNDTQYCDWLATQDWFRERYANVYNQVIINNFTEPTETPEHNRLQMKFLDDDFLRMFCDKVFDFSLQDKFNKNISMIKKKHKAVKKHFENCEQDFCKEILNGYIDFLARIYQIKDFFEISDIKFEQNSFDVAITYNFYSVWEGMQNYYCCAPKDEQEFYSIYGLNKNSSRIFVEIKPCLGDDFPAVLRQIKSNSEINIGRGHKRELEGDKVLIIDKFTAEGATLEQVKKVFSLSEIKLLTFEEIEV